jgi:hypothetical protein
MSRNESWRMVLLDKTVPAIFDCILPDDASPDTLHLFGPAVGVDVPKLPDCIDNSKLIFVVDKWKKFIEPYLSKSDGDFLR